MTNPNIRSLTPSIDERVAVLSELSQLYSTFMSVERATYRDGRPETDGEHTLHAMFLAVAYTAQYHPEFDPGEVALLVMIHDLDEIYSGDTNSLTADDQTMHQKETNEAQDRVVLRDKLQGSPYVLDLLERYWLQEEPVVQYVRAIEKIDPSFAHLRDGGQAIRQMGVITKDQYHDLDNKAVDRMSSYAPPDILAVRQLLGRRVAKATFDAV